MKTHNEQTRVVYDTAIVDYLKTLNPGKVCVTSDPLMIDLGILGPVESFFKKHNIPYEIFSNVHPNPGRDLVNLGLAHIFKAKPDLIVAIGGGSAIDPGQGHHVFLHQSQRGAHGCSQLKETLFRCSSPPPPVQDLKSLIIR